MATVQKQIVDALKADATLTAMILDSGGVNASVWNRPIKAGTGEGATTTAFNATVGGAKEGDLLRSIVVADGGEVAHPSGNRAFRIIAFDTYPRLFFFAEATEAGKVAIDAMDARCLVVLHNRAIAGTTISLTADATRTAFIDSDEFPGNVVCYRRFRGAGTRTIT